jgi:Mg2+ and Co2+ transporter CorA
MNLKFMPETERVFGYPQTLAAMTTTCAMLYHWFHKSGWL